MKFDITVLFGRDEMKLLKELTHGDTGFALMLIVMAVTIMMLAF